VRFEEDFEEDVEGFETDSKGGISSESESGRFGGGGLLAAFFFGAGVEAGFETDSRGGMSSESES